MTTTHKKRRSTRRTHIDKHQAARAIYIDFETIPDEQPTVLGFACEGIWTAAILDRELSDAANWNVPGGNAVALTANEALTLIRNMAISSNRKVCAWSEHDLRVIQRLYAQQPNKRKWWEKNLVNVRRQAVAFVRHHELPATPIVNRKTGRASIGHQAVIMDALGIDVPAVYGRGVAASGIKALRDAIAEHGSLDAVDDESRQKWMAMLLHNRYDCFGMAAIMCPVTRGPGGLFTPQSGRWIRTRECTFRAVPCVTPMGPIGGPRSETAMRKYGRAFHLIDIENLLALTHGIPVWADARSLYNSVAGVEDEDLMFVAADRSRWFDLKVAFPGAEVRPGYGTDGADLALINGVDLDLIARRFATVCIGSGDNRFIDVAYRSRQNGLNVVVVSRPKSLSRALASYADFVIDMPELEFAA